ncbi:hypothetical protein ACFC1R_19600 [Kitasatospora sp. NPDC056138]|uniref:hypothetical protein n=1 Tax=Kitasatospora sp. NPDC056138 TaxID=3345724 RepID=UPI0035E311C0
MTIASESPADDTGSTGSGTGAGTGSTGSGDNTGTASSGSDGTPATAGGGVDRLNPFDGLFLRAEHLTRMQDYALALATAVGAGGGPGVVEGFEVVNSQGVLQIGGGLAIDAYGRPLRSGRAVSLPLAALTPDTDTFWWVEATSAAWEFGESAVQGTLCDDPCSGGATRRPYLAEGVRIRLTPATEGSLGSQPPADRRGWLASRLFAAERTEASPWPYGPAGWTALPGSWAPPPAAPTRPTAVRLAVLVPVSDDRKGWEVDVWAARRDRGGPPPQRYWQGRLGMRPWDVFTAQVLQFQELLADRSRAQPLPASDLASLTDRLARLDESYLKRHTKTELGEEIARMVEQLGAGLLGGPQQARQDLLGLAGLGIHELPPAGYLPCSYGTTADLGAVLTRLLGTELDLRICHYGPAEIAQAVQEAQHRDRIPLAGPCRTGVDILVPADPCSEQQGSWVAFVRRAVRYCGGGSAGAAVAAGD